MNQTTVETIASFPARPEPVEFGPHRKFRWKLWLPIGLVSLVPVYAALMAIYWPFTQQALIDVLQERSLRTVTIGHFYKTYFPPGCTAEDIRFLHKKHKEKQPLIQIGKLVLTTSYAKLLLFQDRLSLVRVTNLRVTVPPSLPGQPNPVMPLTYSKSAPSIKIERVIADGAQLEFLSKPGKVSYRLLIDKLRMDGIGDNLPIPYAALISNQLPPGKIRSNGIFGKWNPKDPGGTPLQGNYTFENANLAVFGGISGTLFSSGSFKGVLRDVRVQGNANVPHFKVRDASHERPLAVAYRATVNGTNGDTRLDEVMARFDSTRVACKGTIAHSEGTDGKTAALDLWTNNARVEDILRLFISDKTSPMRGSFAFSGHLDFPPGPQPFLRKIKMSGDFGVVGKFANARTESELTHLSDSAEKHQKQAPEEPGADVLSNLKGHGIATDGLATLSNVSFAIPGAKAWVHGTYGLTDYKVNLHGTLQTAGSPSKATEGFKSLMVKVVTPFFRRRHSEKVVAFKITGSYSKMNPSLDLGGGKQSASAR